MKFEGACVNVAAWIIGALLIAVFAFAGGTKVLDLDRQRERFGYTATQFRLVGASEVAAAAGLLIGLIWRQAEWLAVAAGIGICALMIGALMAHARVEDEAKDTAPAGIIFVLTVVFMILISLR